MYPLGGGPLGGAYDGAYPGWKAGGTSQFIGAANPPLREPKKQPDDIITSDDEKR